MGLQSLHKGGLTGDYSRVPMRGKAYVDGKCSYCGNAQIVEKARKIVRANHATFGQLQNVELIGNFNRVHRAVNCHFVGNHNRIKYFEKSTIEGNFNRT